MNQIICDKCKIPITGNTHLPLFGYDLCAKHRSELADMVLKWIGEWTPK